MLLLRDDAARAEVARRLDDHLATLRSVHAGECDLRALHAAKLADILVAARRTGLYAELPAAGPSDPERLLDAVHPSLALIDKSDLRRLGGDAFARGAAEFLHYYESSGTTGEPVAAPKALDDLTVNTANIGELWGRLIGPGDVALVLISAPFAPAPYQFEKVLEYLGVMSLRHGVSYTGGDYRRILALTAELGVNTFVGAPSRLLEMCHFALRLGIAPPSLEHLMLIAEQSGPSLCAHLERLTGARAHVGCYGSSETGTIAVTCEHDRLHAQVQSYLLELHDEHGTRRLGDGPDRGELVVTTLDQPARPLLRYRTGDIVEATGERCPCGLALPVLRTLGRAQDLLALPGGAAAQEDVEAALWSADAPGPTVLNYMLVVRRDHVVCLVTTDRPAGRLWSADVAARLAERLPGCRLTVRPVEALPPLASLGGDLGWKLARVLDLDDERAWERLPAPIDAIVRETVGGVAKAAA